MRKFYPSVDIVHKKIIRILLFFFLIPNLSLSQTTVYSSSFETPQLSSSPGYDYEPTSTEWNFYGNSGLSRNWTVFTGANPVAPSGNQVLFLQNTDTAPNGYVEKSFNFPTTGYYRFAFKAAWREICCEKPKYIRVLVDGVEAGEVELRSGNYEEYVTLPLKLTSGAHTIRIEGDNPPIGGDFTGFVDDFRIQQIPEIPNINNSHYTVPSGVYAIGQGTNNFKKLIVDGTLVAPQNEDVTISARYILVRNSGRLQIGQERSPYQHQATITLNGTPSTAQHAHMGTKFIGARSNGVIELHGKEKVSWTKLSETVGPMSSQPDRIKLIEAVDWEVDDEIVIAPSRAPGRTPSGLEDDSFANEYEKRTITAIDKNGITLNAGLTYRHTGLTKTYSGNGQTWTADIRAEVGLLSRNIKIQGDGMGTQFGAHVMIMENAEAYFNGVELYRVGQVKKAGRYPFHWHVRGNADGQYFKNSSVHQSYNRALTLHATDNALVENNVFFDHIGHGIFFETGSEEGNHILGNLVIGSKRPSLLNEAMSQHVEDGETINEWQNRGPASYWITHPNNTIEGNVAAGTVGTGFWYIFPWEDLQNGTKFPQTAPFGSFKNNVAHSTNSGFDIHDALRGDHEQNPVIDTDRHSVAANFAYLSPGPVEMLNSTWYANRIGVYTGTGANYAKKDEYNRETYALDDNLIFKNNIFVDNEKAVMLASNNQIKNSLFVEDTGEGNAPQSGQSLVFMYDGAGTVSNSHIVGYNTSANSFLSFAGATFTYGNFRFKDITKPANNDFVFNAASATGSRNRRNVTIYDEDGDLSGAAGSTLVVDIPFNVLGDESTIPGWTDMKRSSRQYVNTRLKVHKDYHQFYGWMPDVKVIRTKPRTTTVTIDDYLATTNKPSTSPTLPFILNDPDLLYTYEWVYSGNDDIFDIMYTGPEVYNNEDPPVLVNKRILQFKMAVAAEAGKFVIVRFKDMGALPGVYVDMSSDERVYANASPLNLPVTKVTSSSALESYSFTDPSNGPVSAYHIDGNDIYIKAYTNGDFSQFFNIKWNEVPGGGVANNTERLGGEQSLTETMEMIYPNPASSELHIKGLGEGEEVQIVDVSGKIMQTTTYKGYLDISQLESGVYVVRTKSGNHRFIKD
ncbi:MAG: hypothetical protein Roseis2KO_39530 [Roseivirga sp.]